jgi:predicted phage tail protein
MKVVKVYGALRKKLGQCRFQFEADTPAQVLKALCVNFPGLDKWLIDSEQDGISYRVTVGKEKITQQNALLIAAPFSEREVFSITPVIVGAGEGAGQILAGIGLVTAAILLAPVGGGFLGLGAGALTSAGFTLGGAASIAIGGIGAAMILGGVAQALSPAPVQSTSTFERGREAAKLESFSFSGIVNTAKQGLPVPIAYGRVFVGSAVISSGLDVESTGNGATKSQQQVQEEFFAAYFRSRKS